MKHLFSFLLILMLGSLSGFANDWANKGRYAESNAEIVRLDKSRRSVVLMGNSITDETA